MSNGRKLHLNYVHLSAGAMAALSIFASAPPASAYVGPGAGLGLLSAFFALAAVVGLSIVMTLLYPLRALYKKFRGEAAQEQKDSLPSAPDNEENKAS